MTLVSNDNGQEVNRSEGKWGACNTTKHGSIFQVIKTKYFQTKLCNFFKGLASLNQILQTQFFIESPPLAGIFAECEWMDWISETYPDKQRSGREWEFRISAAKRKKFLKHVCGTIPEAAHYVDAVTTKE